MPKFHLVLIIHSHQPVGNFDHVFERTYQHSYLPFVECLQRHPGVRMGLHYSGPLLEWCEQHHPEFLRHLRELVNSNQVELLGGGFYEPILISIPAEDQAAQLSRMSAYLAAKFGRTPSGAWLAERVWEPQLPSVLAASGVAYTLVDDVHFIAAGFETGQLYGDYVTEDCGKTVRVFPGLKPLRYLLPFRSPEEAISFLRDSAARNPGGMASMGDDCEKFGAWPGTYDHCYRDGWLDRFFTALESASDWLVTTTPGDYTAEHPPLGRADLPTASYSEMMEWVLPTAARNEYRAIHQEFESRPAVLRFMRGGPWRAFFTKYSESNLLHKKMLFVSRLLRGVPPPSSDLKRDKLARAVTHLLRGQCNDAYWHGVFGGLYAPHLRTELWRELIRAETLGCEVLSKPQTAVSSERLDFDANGSEEIYVTSNRLAALICPEDGGTIASLDFRPTSVTLINSLKRRLEAYHSRLHNAAQQTTSQVASIHDQVRCKEMGLERFLRYDRWPRNAFRLILFSPDKSFDDYANLRLEEVSALAGGGYQVVAADGNTIKLGCKIPFIGDMGPADSGELLHCVKTFSFLSDAQGFRIDCLIELSSAQIEARRAQLGIEIVLNLLAPEAHDRYFETSAGRHPLRWSAALPVMDAALSQLRVVDEWQNVAATIHAHGAQQMWIAPIETVSESEEGFERVYQGSQIMPVWPVELSIGKLWRGKVSLTVQCARPTDDNPERN